MCDACHAHATAPTEPAPCPDAPPEPALDELIAEQAKDAARTRVPWHWCEIPATDLDGRTGRRRGAQEATDGTAAQRGWRVLRRTVDHRCSPKAWREAADAAMDDAAAAAVRSGGENRAGRAREPQVPTVLIGVGSPWTAAAAQYRPEGGACPACGDSLLPATWLCLVCHASRADPRRWPQQAVEVKARGEKRVRVKRKAAKA